MVDVCAIAMLAWSQYKVGGRLHPADDSSKQEKDKAQAAMTEHELREEARGAEKKED